MSEMLKWTCARCGEEVKSVEKPEEWEGTHRHIWLSKYDETVYDPHIRGEEERPAKFKYKRGDA